MATITRVSLITIFIILHVFCFQQSYEHNGDVRTELAPPICADKKYKHITNYYSQYWVMTDAMEKEMYDNRFSYRNAGKPPDQMYVLAQCIMDQPKEYCALCFKHSTDLAASCFPRESARVYLNGCFIRVDNYSFATDTLSPQDTKSCSSTLKEDDEFVDDVEKLLGLILTMAPKDEGYANIKFTGNNATAVFGLAFCWKTLGEDLCRECLSQAVTSAISCLPSEAAQVLNAGCIIRYASKPFTRTHYEMEKERIMSVMMYFAGSVATCFLAITIGVALGMHIYKRKRSLNKKKAGEVDLLFDKSLQFLQFKFATLLTATDNFNETRRLGQGGFGEVYRGTLPDGREIAIKRLFETKRNQTLEARKEMEIICKAQHKNLVRFLGCCFTKEDSFVVYEYMANRSLDCVLFDPEKKQELDWKKRLMIITGMAEGLNYLHKDSKVLVIHRDIKTSNVLLDLKYKPKISDFGLATFYSSDQSLANTVIAGTLGYMAPEYIANGTLTEKVDVYSFGVVVIEIVTGVMNNKFQSENSNETLVTHVWKHFQANKVPEIIDQSLKPHINAENVEEIKRVVKIGLLCTQECPVLRPTMTKVVNMLKSNDIELPMPLDPPFVDEDMELRYLGADS